MGKINMGKIWRLYTVGGSRPSYSRLSVYPSRKITEVFDK